MKQGMINWFRTLIAILLFILVIIPICTIWIIIQIISFGEIKINFPLNTNGKLFNLLEKLLGPNHWLFS